tara:strand:+ start:356 stop:760 length:405 start_codon:yes stop_codon:yes gene_type:complete
MIEIKNIDINLYFEKINDWFKYYNKVDLNIKLLPRGEEYCLGAFVNNKIVACTFIYTTNSCVWYCDFLIADYKYRNSNRNKVLLKLINEAVESSLKKGAEAVWCTTPYESVLEKLKELKYSVSNKKHYIICKNK